MMTLFGPQKPGRSVAFMRLKYIYLVFLFLLVILILLALIPVKSSVEAHAHFEATMTVTGEIPGLSENLSPERSASERN